MYLQHYYVLRNMGQILLAVMSVIKFLFKGSASAAVMEHMLNIDC